MKHILKGNEPESFSKWKQNDKMHQRGKPNWNRLPSTVKTEIHKHLIREQGGICCYCGIHLTPKSSHIEHLRPKTKYPKHQFDYNNLLCSCQRELQKEEPRHCGNAKGSWFDESATISPLDQYCENCFEYLEDGRIRSAVRDNEAPTITIRHLALDIEKLKELRKAKISAVLDVTDLSDEKDIRSQLNIYSKLNPETKCYDAFCFAVINVLSNLL